MPRLRFLLPLVVFLLREPERPDRRYTDRSGATAAGLQPLAVTSGIMDRPTSFRGKSLPAGPTFGGNLTTRVTLVAGSSCATAMLAYSLAPNGKSRRCR